MGNPETISARDVLQSLLAEVAETDPELLPPPDPRTNDEKSMGTATDPYLKQVYSLASFYRREARRLQVDLEATGEDPLKNVSFAQMKQKSETLQEIFWMLLRTHTNFWAGGCGIRKNWEVVSIRNSKDDNDLPKLLRRLFEN